MTVKPQMGTPLSGSRLTSGGSQVRSLLRPRHITAGQTQFSGSHESVRVTVWGVDSTWQRVASGPRRHTTGLPRRQSRQVQRHRWCQTWIPSAAKIVCDSSCDVGTLVSADEPTRFLGSGRLVDRPVPPSLPEGRGDGTIHGGEKRPVCRSETGQSPSPHPAKGRGTPNSTLESGW